MCLFPGKTHRLSHGKETRVTIYCDKSCTLGGFPGSPAVKSLPSNAGSALSIPGCGTKVYGHTLQPKHQNINRSKKDFKNSPC